MIVSVVLVQVVEGAIKLMCTLARVFPGSKDGPVPSVQRTAVNCLKLLDTGFKDGNVQLSPEQLYRFAK